MAAKNLTEQLKQLGHSVGQRKYTLVDPYVVQLVTDESDPLYQRRAKEAPDADLVDSIRINGLLQPILVRRDGRSEDGTPILKVVAGRRRTIAARKIRDEQPDFRIPIVVHTGSIESALQAAYTENAARKDDTVGSRADLMLSAQRLGKDTREIADLFGCSIRTVDLHLAFTCLHPTVQAYVETNRLAANAIEPLIDVPYDKQPAAVDAMNAIGAKMGRDVGAVSEAVIKDQPAPTSKVGRAKKGTQKAMATKEIKTWLVEITEILEAGDEADDADPIVQLVLRRVLGDREAARDVSHGDFWSQADREWAAKKGTGK